MLNFWGQIISIVKKTRGQFDMYVNVLSSSSFESYHVIEATDDKNFGTYLKSFVQISLISTVMRAAVSHNKLAKHWGVQRPWYNTQPKGVYVQ